MRDDQPDKPAQEDASDAAKPIPKLSFGAKRPIMPTEPNPTVAPRSLASIPRLSQQTQPSPFDPSQLGAKRLSGAMPALRPPQATPAPALATSAQPTPAQPITVEVAGEAVDEGDDDDFSADHTTVLNPDDLNLAHDLDTFDVSREAASPPEEDEDDDDADFILDTANLAAAEVAHLLSPAPELSAPRAHKTLFGMGALPSPSQPFAPSPLPADATPEDDEDDLSDATAVVSSGLYQSVGMSPPAELSVEAQDERDDALDEGGATTVFSLAELEAEAPVAQDQPVAAPVAAAPALDWRAPPPRSSAPLPAETPAPDDLNDDFNAQATELIQSPFEKEQISPRLLVQGGPMAGREFFVTALRSTLGRAENNTIMIADLSISRHHMELIKNPDDTFLLRDLGSNNGTFLNGTQIKEAAVFEGDRIEAGKTSIQFIYPPAKPRPHRHMIPVAQATMHGAEPIDQKTSMAALQLDQSTRLFTRISVVAAALCIPLIGLLLYATLRDKPAEPASPQAVAIAPEQQLAANAYLQGVQALKDQDWEEAQGHFQRAATKPELAAQANRQIARITEEQAAMERLRQARALVNAPDAADELNALIAKIPRESVYFDEAQKLNRRQRTDDVATLYQRAQAHFSADELELSERQLNAALAIVPEHAGALALQATLRARREELAKQEQDKLRQDAATAAVDPFASKDPPAPRVTSSASASVKQALDLYKRERFAQAITALESIASGGGGEANKARALARDVKNFRTSYSAGNDALAQKSWARAVEQLTRAREADARLGNAFKKSLDEGLATAHGEQGMLYLKKRQYPQAKKALTSGLKHQASSPAVTTLSQALEREATTLYVQAVDRKKSDPGAAQELCKQIMLMVPSSSPSWKKASRLMLD